MFTYHEINIKSKNGIVFRFNIEQSDSSDYFSLNTDDNHVPESRCKTAEQAFIKAINIITNNYCKDDDIVDIHNPCNTCFISEDEQNKILSDLDIDIEVRVN